MTDDDVTAEAIADGFTLEERVASHTGAWAWGWVRGDDDRYPCFLERRQAIAYMADRLNRIEVFQ